MRDAFSRALLKLAAQRDELFVISGDAGLGVFDEYVRRWPDRFLNLGIAEQNAASFAAGLGLTGSKVVWYNIIPFLLYRCYEQVRNDICYQKVPVALVGVGSGLTYAPQGMTHYAIEDLGITATLPGLTVFSPCDPMEAEAAVEYALTADSPVYVRLTKRGDPVFHSGVIADIRRPQIIHDGEEVAILFHGSISVEVMRACQQLQACGRHPRVISVPLVQPLGAELLLPALQDIQHVVCVEEHYRNCGLGQRLAELRTEHHQAWNLLALGLENKFEHRILDANHLRETCGISASAIVAAANRCFAR